MLWHIEQSNDAHRNEMTAMCVDSYQNKGYHDIIAQSNHHRRARYSSIG